MSKIWIIGSGLTAASACATLRENGVPSEAIKVFEKKKWIGGLCRDYTYETHCVLPKIAGQYGPHSFHTDNRMVWNFVKRHAHFTDYRHRKGVEFDNELWSYPLVIKELMQHPQWNFIHQELEARINLKPDPTNFATWCIGVFGMTLYRKFIENYTRKLWLMDPDKLPSSWAPQRLKFGDEKENYLFSDEYQGIPVGGYTPMMKSMFGDIEVSLDYEANYSSLSGIVQTGDVIVATCAPDDFWRNCFGPLEFCGVRWINKMIDSQEWPDMRFGTINTPQDEEIIRKCNYSIIYEEKEDYNMVGAEFSSNDRMYPVNIGKNKELVEKYYNLQWHVPILFCGRLGGYEYIDMDDAIADGIWAAREAMKYVR